MWIGSLVVCSVLPSSCGHEKEPSCSIKKSCEFLELYSNLTLPNGIIELVC
jgi:hypothetical protein